MWLWKDAYLSFIIIIIIVYNLCVVCNCKGSLARRDKRSLSAPPWEEAIELIREELEKVPIAQFEGDITLFQRVDAASHLTSYLLHNDNFSVVYERGTNDFGVEAIVLNPEEDKLPWKNQKRRFVGLRLKNTGDYLYYVVFAYLRYYDKAKDRENGVESVGGQWALEWDMWDYRGPGKNRFTNFGFSNCAPSAIVPCGYNSALDAENSLRPSGIKQRWMPMSRTLRNPPPTKLPAFAIQSGFDVDANFEFYGDLEVTKDGHDHGSGRSVKKGSEGGEDSPTVKPQVPEWLSSYSTSYSANAHQKQQTLGWSGSKERKRRGLEKKDSDKLKPIPAIPRMDDRHDDASSIFGSRERSGEEFLRRGRKEKLVTRGRNRDSDDSRSIERTRSRIGDDRRRKDSRESRRKIRVRTEDDVSSDRELSLARYRGPTSSRYELNAKDREQSSRLREIEVESESPSGWKSSSRARERVSVTRERERYSQREEGDDRMKYLEQEIDRSREDSSRSRVGYKSRDRDDMLDRNHDHDSGKYAKKKDGSLKHSSTREKDPLPSSPDFSSPHTTANIVQSNPSSMLNEEPPKLAKEVLISNQSFPINEDTPKPPKSSQRFSTDEDVSHVPFQKNSVKPRPAEDVDAPKMLPNVNNGFASQPKTENEPSPKGWSNYEDNPNPSIKPEQTMHEIRDHGQIDSSPKPKSPMLRGIKPKGSRRLQQAELGDLEPLGVRAKGGVIANAASNDDKALANAVDNVGIGAEANAVNGSQASANALSTKDGDALSQSKTYGPGGARSNSMAMGSGVAVGTASSYGDGNALANAVAKSNSAQANAEALSGGNSQANAVSNLKGDAMTSSMALKGNSHASSVALGSGAANAGSLTEGGGNSYTFANARGGGRAYAHSEAKHGGTSDSIASSVGSGSSLSNSVSTGGFRTKAISTAEHGDSVANAVQDSSEDDASFDANSFSTRVQTMPDDTFKVLTPQAKSRGIKPKTYQQQKWKPKKYGLEEEGTFFALGWKTQYMPPNTPNVTFRYEDDPFYGMGSCPHRAVLKSELDDASGHAKSVINIYTSLLRNYCLGFGETLKALVDHEVLRSSNTLFLLNLTSAHIKRRKLTAVRLEELELAFELYLFSTQLNELSGKEPESKGPDKSLITRSVHFLSNIILRGVDWARGPGRLHLVHLTRHLIIVTKVTYTKLLQDFDFLEPCTQCVADKELNYNDRIEVMALLEFLINGLAPVDNGDMAEHAFVNFFSLNLNAIQAHVSVLVN